MNIRIIYATKILGSLHVFGYIRYISFGCTLGMYYMVKRRFGTMVTLYNISFICLRRLIPMLLFFDDNKIKMARKPGKKQKENPVGWNREGKYEKEI